jgi:hypothetical protein
MMQSARRRLQSIPTASVRLGSSQCTDKHAAAGYCRACGVTHSLPRTAAAERLALELVARVRREGRLDFDADVANARFSARRLWAPGGGKMFGVLLATSRGGSGDGAGDSMRVLKAFSGQLFGEWRVPGWVPPLAGLTHDDARYQEAHARIAALSAAHAAAVDEVGLRRAQLAAVEAGSAADLQVAIAAARAAREGRRERRRQAVEAAEAVEEAEAAAAAVVGVPGPAGRGGGPSSRPRAAPSSLSEGGVTQKDALAALVALNSALADQSRADKRQLAALKAEGRGRLAAPAAALGLSERRREALSSERRCRSRALQAAIWDSYALTNFRGRTAAVADVFVVAEGGGGGGGGGARASAGAAAALTTDGAAAGAGGGGVAGGQAAAGAAVLVDKMALPSGCGDCCAPKLLAAAASQGLVPLAIAEVWLGAGSAPSASAALVAATGRMQHGQECECECGLLGRGTDGGAADADALKKKKKKKKNKSDSKVPAREEGKFYAACRGRCWPILGHMLCGAAPTVGGQQQLATTSPTSNPAESCEP